MRSRLLLPALLAMAMTGTVVGDATSPPGPRQTINFNRDWKFKLGDFPGAEAPSYHDAEWETVGLPHSFSIPYFASDKFYVGYGWYRKHFTAPPAWNGREIFLEFDAAFQDAEVYLNGAKLGEHLGGYTGFSIDLTPKLAPGDNVVAVRLNNNWNPQLAPRAGEHVFSGGIYRDVRLVVTSPLHVTWYGTFVTTPQVSAEAATVNVKTEVANQYSTPRSATLVTHIMGPDGAEVAQMHSNQTVAADGTIAFDQTSPQIAHPQLWSPDHPTLYSVRTEVFDGSMPADSYTSPLGIRSIRFTADQGFFLNGQHLYLLGANVHQDHAGWGDAVTQAGAWRDVRFVKEAGFNFIRGSHYPHSPAFVRACDTLGLLLWSENPLWGIGGFGADGNWFASAYPVNPGDEAGFQAGMRQELTEEIRMYRNDPSVIVWSMSNEPFFTADAAMPRLRAFLVELVALSHRLDPTRPAAIGGCQRGDIDKLGDIAGYNGDGATVFLHPGLPSVVSEFEGGAGRYGHWGTLVDFKNGDDKPPYFWRYPWRSGEAVWCMFDHGSISGGLGRTGIMDYFRLPKPDFYWWRQELRHVPIPPPVPDGTPAGLALTADKTTLGSVDGTDDTQIIASVVDADGRRVNSNRTTTLTIESGPGQFPTGPSITFDPATDISMNDGQGAIEFRSYFASQTVIRATSPGLKDATITITSLGVPAFVPGQTPSAVPHPYVRFTGEAAQQNAAHPVFGVNNPTSSSSSAAGHPSFAGNDGNPATFWQAADPVKDAFWQVDLERYVLIRSIKVGFPAEGSYRFRVESSVDEVRWNVVADETNSTATGASRTLDAPDGTKARYVRLVFPAAPAALSTFQVEGSQLQ